MARLLSVNVGLPRDIEWKGRTVHTGIWKAPVQGRCAVGTLGLAGDGQGDVMGHGGEQRAVMVYQIESYRYWQAQLSRSDFVYGQFCENFTIEGMPDSEVCIGDVFRIGSAEFEVTQPRVTCYRVGIRMDEPRMPALLTSNGRPGFYLRVLREGDVGAGDEIVKVREASERMTVETINALLYSPAHPRDRLERALRIGALSRGWRGSFESLLNSAESGVTSGNAGLAPGAVTNAATPGFRLLRIEAIEQESLDVVSFVMEAADGQPLQRARAGQYVVLRLRDAANAPPFFRSYSLSGTPSERRYRISVKIEPHGAAGTHLREHVHVGDTLDVSFPRGGFVLDDGDGPLVLLSAGIGVTPVFAMLLALSEAKSTRSVLWIHAAHDGAHHPFAEETDRVLRTLAKSRRYVCYSTPSADERVGEHFDAVGRLSPEALNEVGIAQDADVYLCGPARFMNDMTHCLNKLELPPKRVHTERFGGVESMTPGVIDAHSNPPHAPRDAATEGPVVSFARSNISVRWGVSTYRNILELAEACDVPVRWSCRAGVCHNCESGLVSGALAYDPAPLDKPSDGNVLICCARPLGDVVVDL